MLLLSLNARSPIDGRYRGKVESLGASYAEAGVSRYRVKVEVVYVNTLCEIP